MPDPTTLTITFGADSAGRYVASIADSNDTILGGRGDTEQAAVERAIGLYFSVRNPAAAVTVSNTFTPAPRTKRVAVGTANIRKLIEDAIRADTTIKITYGDAKGNSTVREVEPQRFSGGAMGSENVETWDHLRGDVRLFRLDRIKRAEEV